MARSNIKDSFEKVYLLDTRLSKSFSKESSGYIKNKEVIKIMKYSCGLIAKKHKGGMYFGGIEYDDLMTAARCYSSIFFTLYNKNFKNDKHRNNSLTRFLGQKLSHYIELSKRKFNTPISYVESEKVDFLADSDRATRRKLKDDRSRILEKVMSATPKQKRALIKQAKNSKSNDVKSLAQDLCELAGINYID